MCWTLSQIEDEHLSNMCWTLFQISVEHLFKYMMNTFLNMWWIYLFHIRDELFFHTSVAQKHFTLEFVSSSSYSLLRLLQISITSIVGEATAVILNLLLRAIDLSSDAHHRWVWIWPHYVLQGRRVVVPTSPGRVLCILWGLWGVSDGHWEKERAPLWWQHAY